MTKVVNLYREEFGIYIGRPGKGQDGYFGNPVVVGEQCPVCGQIHVKPGETLVCYREYLQWRVDHDPEFRVNLQNLRGKTLGCFCKPRPCHGDVIVEWLEENDEVGE